MFWVRRFSILFALLFTISFIAWYVPRALDPTTRSPERRAIDRQWVNSSPYWLDRQACRWISVCGLHHLRSDPAAHQGDDSPSNDEWRDLRKRGEPSWEGTAKPEPKTDKKRNPHERRKILKDVPKYVMDYAPLVHLYSGEEFWPSDIKEHIEHMTVTVDGEVLNTTEPWTLDNLEDLNDYGRRIILHSNDDVESRPTWLHSHDNVPNPFGDGGEDDDSDGSNSDGPTSRREPTSWFDVGRDHPLHRISSPRPKKETTKLPSGPQSRLSRRGHKPDADGYSKAPAVLVVVDKGSGIVDAFWFFFYSYNLGQTVLGIRFGNHIGDWEHCMVRFENGVPRGIFFSEHEGGQAYAWEAVEKRGDRPVIYSAVGSHAMYALPGIHAYVLPFRLLKDITDKGPLWDPSLNNYAYHYDYALENPENTHEDDDMAIMTDADEYGFMDDDARELKAFEEAHVFNTHSVVPAASNPKAPTSWFHFRGRWGDEVYSLADPRQWRLFGQYHYVTGPIGPKFKNLDRPKVCQNLRCRILYKLDPKGTWY